MPAPLVAAGLKYLAGQAMDKMGAPKELTSFIGGPKNFMLDKLKGAVDTSLGVTPGTTNMVTNPKGALMDTAKNYVKDKVREAYDADDSSMTATDSGSPDMQQDISATAYKRGGKVKSKSSYQSTSKMSSASRRGDGIAQRGKTKGRLL
jgi:hypothetical protein